MGKRVYWLTFLILNPLAEAVSTLLSDRELAATLGRNAREFVVERFSLEKCVPRQLDLMQLVASGALI